MSAEQSRSLTRAAALALDAADPLARFRDYFAGSAKGDVLYMDGNSLGRQPLGAELAVAEALRAWRDDYILAWRDWIKLPTRLGDLMSAIIEADPGEVVFGDSTTVNLYKAADAALSARPDRSVVVTTDDQFPTDLYVLQSLCRQRSLRLEVLNVDAVEGLQTAQLAAALNKRSALVCLSHVAYRSGALLDMRTMTHAAHEAGALMLWDVSHSAGAVEVPLRSSGADLAVGCSYKYLNGGPGAPAYIYVRKDLQARLEQPIWGWFGHRDQFAMAQAFEPAEGIERFLSGAPVVLSIVAIKPGLRLIAEAGIPALQRKGQALTDLIIALAEAWLSPYGVNVASPRDAKQRGAHISLRVPDAKAVVRALIANGVIPDYRPPDLVRLGPAPVYTRFVDVWDAMDRLRSICSERA